LLGIDMVFKVFRNFSCHPIVADMSVFSYSIVAFYAASLPILVE